MIHYKVDPEPKVAEIVKYSIASTDPDYDLSWIKGELLLRINCVDGVVLIYYVPINKNVKTNDFVNNENATKVNETEN